MTLEEYKQRYNENAAPGWDAIEESLRKIYGAQEPMHWGTLIKHMLGGPDPLDGISAYPCRDGGEHLHFVSYGFSELYYAEDAVGKDFSKWGFEMTFRLAGAGPASQEHLWVCVMLQDLARYVFESGRWFEAYQWISTPGPICRDLETDLVGLAVVPDPALPAIDTPHGRVEFLQAYGLTQAELDPIIAKTDTCRDLIERHRQTNPMLITDLARK